jgi:hypothetical protein
VTAFNNKNHVCVKNMLIHEASCFDESSLPAYASDLLSYFCSMAKITSLDVMTQKELLQQIL